MFEGRKEQMVKSIPKPKKAFLLSLTFLSLIMFPFSISVNALEDDDVVDISKLPNKLAEALNAPLFAGQLLASAIPFCIICFPAFLLTKNTIAHISAIVISLSFALAMGWLPYWILLLLSLLIAFLYANEIKGVFAR